MEACRSVPSNLTRRTNTPATANQILLLHPPVTAQQRTRWFGNSSWTNIWFVPEYLWACTLCPLSKRGVGINLPVPGLKCGLGFLIVIFHHHLLASSFTVVFRKSMSNKAVLDMARSECCHSTTIIRAPNDSRPQDLVLKYQCFQDNFRH